MLHTVRKGGTPVAKLEIRLMGPPRILASGPAPPLRRRKALGLTAYLAASRTPQTRELLAAVFWPDAGREDAHTQLRNHLWLLRRAGLAPWLSIEGDMVALHPGEGLFVDTREHRRLLEQAGLALGADDALHPRAEAMLKEAVALYQGQFLAGFSLADSVAFEEWQLREEEALRTAQGRALDALIRVRQERGDWEAALATTRLRLELDPLDERALRTLMALLLRLGRRAEALQAYERCRKLLARELDVAPCRETLRLRNQIMAEDPGPAGSRSTQVERPRTVLPAAPTPFVGREGELDEIARCFEAPESRLVTLTGPGGCGKTRLALEAGRRLDRSFTDGVVFVRLVSVEDGNLLPAALAEALCLPLGGRDRATAHTGPATASPGAELIDFLREKRILLVLDNLEQVGRDLGPLRTILAGTRHAAVLATSRSRLHLAGERVLEVEGLPWPARKASAEEISGCPAVRLFLQAVRRRHAKGAASRENLLAAADITRRLRGHPLGIELAASWSDSLSPAEIARRLAAGLDLEAAPRADFPNRHQSLRVVFEQSWNRLSARERAALRRISLLDGSFDRAAALAVGRTTPEVLASLVEQSLLRRVDDDRMEVLETLRQFGREKLRRSPREENAARDRAARHYLEKLATARAALEGAGQTRALRVLTRDRYSLRPAWLRAAERRWLKPMSRAFRSLFLFYDMSSRVVEGAETFAAGGRYLTGPEGQRLRALSRVAQAWFLRYQDPRRRLRLTLLGRKDLQGSGRPEDQAFAAALAFAVDPPLKRGMADLRDGALSCEAAGDLWCAGLAWEVLAYHLRAGDPAEGLRALHRSLTLRRRSRDRWSVALGVYVMGLLLEERGLLRGSRRRYEESLVLRRRLGADPDGVLDCLDGIARVSLRTGAIQDALRHGEEALQLAQKRGNRVRIGLAQTRVAQIHCLAGTVAEAGSLLASALASAEAIEDAPWASHLHALAGLAALDRDDAQEARWSLERALTAASTPAGPGTSAPIQDAWYRGWSPSWHDLLGARLAVARNDTAAAGRLLASALRDAVAAHHEPMVCAIIGAWAERHWQSGRIAPAVRLAKALLAGPILSGRLRARLEDIRNMAGETGDRAEGEVLGGAPPSAGPAASAGTLRSIARRPRPSATATAAVSETTLFRLAAELLSGGPDGD